MLVRTAKFLTHQLITKKMAISEIDTVGSARILIEQFGVDAKNEAEKRIAYCRDARDEEGAALWVRIGSAAEHLLTPPRESLH